MNEFRHLITEYQSQVYGMILRQGVDEEMAKDISQETFIKAYNSLKKFKGNSGFGTWVTRIALNKTTDYYRSKKYKQKIKTDSIEGKQIQNREKDNSDDQLLALKNQLCNLKPIYRDVIVLSCFEGKSYKEISEILDIPEGTVASRINKGVHSLKDLINSSNNIKEEV